MGTPGRICILFVIIPVLVICGVNAELSDPSAMFYRNYVDKDLGFSINIPVYWNVSASNFPPYRSDIEIKDPLSHSAVFIDCLWTRNDAYPYFYGRNWPDNHTPDSSAELSTVNDGLLSLAGKNSYDGMMNYYLYNETRFPGKGDSKYEYAVTSFVPGQGLMRTLDNEDIMEHTLWSIRIFDPGKAQPPNPIPLPLYPGMINLEKPSEIPQTGQDSNASQADSSYGLPINS